MKNELLKFINNIIVFRFICVFGILHCILYFIDCYRLAKFNWNPKWFWKEHSFFNILLGIDIGILLLVITTFTVYFILFGL